MSFFNLAPKGDKTKAKTRCPRCGNMDCFRHCKSCGTDIEFRKDDSEKWTCYEYHSERKHSHISQNFWRDCVVQEKDNVFVRNEKIRRYLKLTGYGYVEGLKEEKNLWLAEKWREYSFEWSKK